jgi:hypothetical protein
VLVLKQNKYDKKQKMTEIQLAYFFVKNYLILNRLQSIIARYLQETFARSSIAEVCLAYLLELELSNTAK